MKRLTLLFGILLLVVAPVWAQKVAETRWPFVPGEELFYEAELSRSLLRGVNIAELKFTVAQGPSPDIKGAHAPATYRFIAEAQSKGALVKLFRQHFRQYFESTADAATLAALNTSKADIQNKRERLSEAVFDYRAGQLTWTEHNPRDANAPPRVVTAPLSGAAYDLVSVWYHLRTLRTLTPGTTLTLPISDSGAVYRIAVKVVERKTFKTVLGKVTAVRLDPDIFGDDKLIRGKGKMSVWLTDDVRRIPVKGSMSSDLGKLDITLKKAVN